MGAPIWVSPGAGREGTGAGVMWICNEPQFPQYLVHGGMRAEEQTGHIGPGESGRGGNACDGSGGGEGGDCGGQRRVGAGVQSLALSW